MENSKNVRIKHTPFEYYAVDSCLICKSELFKGIKRWYPYKYYSSKQSAFSAIKRYKEKHKDSISSNLVFRIVWVPSYYSENRENCVCVYDESIEGGEE